MVEKTIYVADDGAQFDFEEDCIAYENGKLYSNPEVKKEIFCFNREGKRYFPKSYEDFENLSAFYCESQRAYDLLKEVEEHTGAMYLPFEGDSQEPEEYEEEKASFVKTHWLWGIDDDVWMCLEYEEEILKKRMAEQNKRIQEEKEKENGEE